MAAKPRVNRGSKQPVPSATTKNAPNRPSFTLRFDDEDTHETLRVVADEMGVSMNRLAEEFIASGLRVAVLGLEERLSQTLLALQSYRGEGIEEDLIAFAHAEATVEDPIATRLLPPEPTDPLGVGAVFASRVD
jgi:hypothetical protein